MRLQITSQPRVIIAQKQIERMDAEEVIDNWSDIESDISEDISSSECSSSSSSDEEESAEDVWKEIAGKQRNEYAKKDPQGSCRESYYNY